MRLFSWLLRRSPDPEQFVRSPERAIVELRDGTVMSVRRLRDIHGEEEIAYAWPTKLSAYELLVECTSYIEHQNRFVSPITVFLFTAPMGGVEATDRSQGLQELSLEQYLKVGNDPEYKETAVRFNAQAPFDTFSVTWAPLHGQAGGIDVRGKVLAVFGPKTPDMMLSMIEQSVTDRGQRHIRHLIAEGKALQPALP